MMENYQEHLKPFLHFTKVYEADNRIYKIVEKSVVEYFLPTKSILVRCFRKPFYLILHLQHFDLRVLIF